MTLNPANDTFLTALAEQLPPGTLKAPEPRYLSEPRGKWAGQAGAVATPRSVEDVAAIVRACVATGVAVVPYGGGTGLVGGQVASDIPTPLVLSLEKMNKIRAVYPDENVIVVDAGAILQDVQAAADEVGRLFPLALASQGSAQIGGNLATNAGGLNVLRYGNTRDLCLGLEAVLPSGDIWRGLTRLRKDNTGYDLRNLLIGSEGTLGVITGAALKLSPKPASTATAMMVVPSPRAALDLLALARDHMAEAISSFELIGRMGFDFLSEVLPEVQQPFDTPPEWCVLIDLGLSQGVDGDAAMLSLFEAAMEAELVTDGVVAKSDAQRAGLWQVRERIPEANRKIGSIASHDVSLPLGEIPDFIAEAPAKIAQLGDLRINCFGHLGDGNLHYNVFPPKGRNRAEYAGISADASRIVHDLVVEKGGSFSAEHGVGRLKTNDLARYGDPARLTALRAIKSALDPIGIMNPGAVLSD